MPFKSAKQRKACFATNGFNGAINCREWAKKDQGGMTMYRKKCKECGGKMYQNAGYIDPRLFRPVEDFNDPNLRPAYQEEPAGQGLQYANRIQEGIAQGIIEAPRADSPDEQMTAQQWYDMRGGAPSQKQKKSPYDLMQRIGIGSKAVRTGLGWLSGIIERGRQNKYDYEQQTALGQMNPMQVEDFQPTRNMMYAQMGGNPFSHYARYGGNLKTIMKEYMKFSNDAQFDFGSGDDDKGKMKKGGYEIDRMLVVRKFLPELLKIGRMGGHKYRNYQTGGTYKTQQEIDADNAITQGILARQGIPNAATYVAGRDVGDPRLKFVGQGVPRPSGQTTLPAGIDIDKVYETSEGLYGYNHPQEDYFVPVNQQAIFAKYGKKKPEQIAPVSQMRDLISMASKYRRGGKKK